MTYEQAFIQSLEEMIGFKIDSTLSEKLNRFLKGRVPTEEGVRDLAQQEIGKAMPEIRQIATKEVNKLRKSFFTPPDAPINHGAIWMAQDEADLEYAFNNFISAYSNKVGRTFGAIKSRLLKMVKEYKL